MDKEQRQMLMVISASIIHASTAKGHKGTLVDSGILEQSVTVAERIVDSVVKRGKEKK